MKRNVLEKLKVRQILKVLNIVLCIYILVGVFVIGTGQKEEKTNAATVSLNSWALYSRKTNSVVYCNDDCIYWDRFKAGVKVWNAYKKEVLKKASKGDIVTCRVQDLVEISTMNGRTYPSGFIVFNPNGMRKLNQKQRNNVVIHEIGHALGLGHNGYWDVMYPYVCSNVKLSANDKASFKRAYSKFVL